MMHQALMPIKTLAMGMFFTAGVLLALVIVPILGQILEGHYFPVIEDVYGEIAERTPNSISYEFYGDKTRGECKIIGIEALVLKNKIWYRPVITINGNPPLMRHRLGGFQSFGVWKFSPSGERVRVVVRHDCHPLWDTLTLFGEWPTNERPNP